MKQLIIILLSLFLFSFTGNKPKNDLEKNHLKGPVQSITEIPHDHQNTVTKNFSKYDKFGNLIKEAYATSSGDSVLVNNITTYSYDSNGVLISYMTKYLGQFTRYGCKYDMIGRLVSSVTYDSLGNIMERDSSLYNSKGNVEQIIKFEKGIDNQWRKGNVEVFLYDRRNNLTGSYNRQYVGNDTLRNDVDYKNYRNGDVKEAAYFYGSKCISIFHMKYIKYDKLGNWIQAILNDELYDKKDTIKRTIEYY